MRRPPLSFLLPFAIAAAAATAAHQPARAAPPADYPAVTLPDASALGLNVQRTMRLLATSTPEKRHTVRILFYGQSITEQAWSKDVADDLRKRFPHADLVIENRALGGYASQLLVKTAETDLYPFMPDLVAFHVYGAHDKYADIIRRTRERTTAEILQQTDHVTRPDALTEETDPAKLPPRGTHWDAFMNHNWLPSLSRKYGTELCDQRAIWKRYLTEHKLEPRALLRDNVHLNAHGEWLMAQCVSAYLRYDPKLGPSPAEEWVKTLEIGKDLKPEAGAIRAEIDANRIDLIFKPGAAAAARVIVRIDGKRPSEHPSLYQFTRALAKPGGKWPVVADLSSDKPPLLEEWTLQASADPNVQAAYTFTVSGSETGPDGGGRTDQKFVSKSGRLVIDPEDWNVKFAMALAGMKTPPAQFTARWRVVPHFQDEPAFPANLAAGVEPAVTVAHGLPNGRHTLELSGADALAAIRVYRPPLAPTAADAAK